MDTDVTRILELSAGNTLVQVLALLVNYIHIYKFYSFCSINNKVVERHTVRLDSIILGLR